MRIGMMTDLYKPYMSGVTIYIEINKRYLEQQGHEVFVFTFGNDKDYVDDEINIFRSPGLPISNTGFSFNFYHKREIKKIIQSMDVLHVHHPFISGRLALRYGRPLNIPIVFTNHTRYDLYAQSYAPGLPKGVSNTFLETYMPKFCDSVSMAISPSKGMADVLRELKIEAPITIVPNGVETSRFKSASSHGLRKMLGFSTDDVLLIYAGRLAPEKNLPFVINTFKGVAQAVENAHMLIIGGGPSETELKELAAQSSIGERIHFIGQVNYDDMPSYLNMCDVFVTASTSEVHPLSVIEAMAAGLPVLGIYSPGISDTVESGGNGYLSNEDVAEFSAKMTRLAVDNTLRKKMGSTARESSDLYAIERTGAIMLSNYQKLVAESGPRRHGIMYNIRRLWEQFTT
jgi:1,2-diacylglycerol 3-alpha-glucosyltransferase